MVNISLGVSHEQLIDCVAALDWTLLQH